MWGPTHTRVRLNHATEGTEVQEGGGAPPGRRPQVRRALVVTSVQQTRRSPVMLHRPGARYTGHPLLKLASLSGVAEDAALVSVLRARSRRSAILEGATSYE